ncbi:MAG: SIMPL domain-containing protein, partial [Burkholderiaceae bacterium]|nr:SIMPL domain-containing protein [Burkholderiaceae bacterium]
MKYRQTITALALLAMSMSAMAQNALHDTRISPQGVNLTLVGHATVVVPNDHARLLWTAQSQEATLQEATANAIAQMNKGIEAIKSVTLDAKLQTMNVN